MEGGSESCASWIRRPENRVLVVVGKPKIGVSLPLLEVFSFDVKTASLSADPLVTCAMGEEDGDPVGFAVHPSGEEIVCSTAKGCKLFELCDRDLIFKLVAKDLPPLHSVGPQKCLAFSTDGSKFVTGGQDGHLRIIEWPSLKVLLDEPRAHKCFRDMDISLDSEFLVSTSTDGSARIWKINGAAPMISLTRNPDEKIECCRFSRDGMRPFLFCTVQKGGKVVTAVWDISTWNRIGFKRLLRKPISALSVSLDGKYLALIVISTSNQRGAVITKLNVPADWKEWQIYFLLLFLFLGSAVIFYLFHEHSDSFWNFPLGRNQPNRPYLRTLVQDSQLADDQSPW
ncbi:SEC12-like protein 1 isoform X2 [Dendrobium catenatum]|uniref:SEC12-like protein 1 isoform X2 n=1 Tax=Dendrobium catenatum TaxID=906689 RepID=UPI0009F36377|nr:SEC12-like protein 1 isoform X2 [Dendrobium catenatum]